ncbi:PRD domain-containing protein [Clostridium sp. cel8]|nr:PRD domain-containing protein [Clostridium sp. cel8]
MHTKKYVKFENTYDFKIKNKLQFIKIRKEITQLENEYDITINDDEICYIILILQNNNLI